jgi:hypothetical protein
MLYRDVIYNVYLPSRSECECNYNDKLNILSRSEPDEQS